MLFLDVQDEFDWLRGALSTVDRSFGVVLNHVFHRITDTHVAHHLFHTMPFYHAAVSAQLRLLQVLTFAARTC